MAGVAFKAALGCLPALRTVFSFLYPLLVEIAYFFILGQEQSDYLYFENSKILCISGSYIAFAMVVSKCLAMFQGLQWESDAHFAQEMNCGDRSPYSCLIVLVLSLALRWMVWPGCS